MYNHREETRKSILKRDTQSFDEQRQNSYLCPDRGMLDRKTKSFEDREDDCDCSQSRIFNRSQTEVTTNSTDDDNYVSWTTSIASETQGRSRSNAKIKISQNV